MEAMNTTVSVKAQRLPSGASVLSVSVLHGAVCLVFSLSVDEARRLGVDLTRAIEQAEAMSAHQQ